MKTIKKNIIKLATIGSLAIGMTSCSDFLKEYSQDLAKVQTWSDLDEVLLGDAYMPSARIYLANYSIYSTGESALDILHFMGDEITLSQTHENDYLSMTKNMFPFYTWQQDTGTDEDLKYVGGDEAYWNDLYKRINVCNMVISLIDEQPEYTLDDAVQKERVKGEAHFLRGMYYFYLANLYAQPYDPATAEDTPGVPVKLSNFVEDVEFPRSSLKETYEQIISDFSDAAVELEGKTAKSKYHANATAAKLMLARVNLYMQNWDGAVAYAKAVLADNNQLQSLRSVALGANSVSIASPETIFSMGHYLIAANFASDKYGDYDPAYYVSDNMIDLYDRDDLRRGRYFGNTSDGYFNNVFLKYNLQYGNWGGMCDVSSYCLLRTSEAYMILAEASAYNNDENTARETLDRFLQTRVQSAEPVTLQGNALIDFIRDERAREFLLEGHRWFDLRRYTVCQPYKWSKIIVHSYNYFTQINWDTVLDHIDTYTLDKFDQAYTLPIPRSVREFQVSLGNNPRPARIPNVVKVEPEDDDDDDDWDW